jgi:hypothetical protein
MSEHAEAAPSVKQDALVLGVIGVVLLRICTSHDSFPGWSGDPLELPSPILGITPIISLLLDALLLVLSSALLWCSPATSVRRLLLLFIAAGFAAYHACFRRGGDIDDALQGFNWIAALTAGVALSAGCSDSRRRALAFGAIMSIIPLLVLKGAHQYFIEHAETLAAFKTDKDHYLASQGWSPGSSMALAYERRIGQAEALGWFGLANVYATTCAAGLVAVLGTLWSQLRSNAPRWSTIGLGLISLGAGFALVLAGAKGGYAAAGLGVAIFALPRLVPTKGTRAAAAFIAVACVAGPLAAIAARGAVGERLHELSLLFRWYYLEGASRIFADHWTIGLGPSGFRDAYVLAKPALSPEDVTSPHSVLFDYACAFGLGGLALGACWFGLVLDAARGMFTPCNTPPTAATVDLRSTLRMLAAPLATGILASAYLEQPIASPASTLIRLGGITGGMVVGAAIFRAFMSPDTAGRRYTAIALGAAALTLAAHAQIEMTCINPGAAGWIMCVLGIAASNASPRRDHRPTRALGAMGALALAALLVMFTLPRVITWEHSLRRAYQNASVAGELSVRASWLGKPGPSDGDSPELFLKDLGAALGTHVKGDKASIESAFRELRRSGADSSTKLLQAAADAWPNHFPTARSLSRLFLARSEFEAQDAKEASIRQAHEIATNSATRCDTSAAWSWVATTMGPNPEGQQRVLAINALSRASNLAPREPSHLQRLAQLLRTSDPAAARDWAAKALAADANMRLDPLRQFSKSERQELEAIAAAK